MGIRFQHKTLEQQSPPQEVLNILVIRARSVVGMKIGRKMGPFVSNQHRVGSLHVN